MAVAQVGSTSTDGSGFSTTVSLAKPTGTANGQLAIFGVIIYNTSTFTVPSGWTADFNGLNGSSNSRMLVAHRVLDGSETWPLVVTQSSANQIGGCLAVFSGASGTLDVGTLADANTAAITLGAVTLTAANGALLGIVGQTHGNSGSIAFSGSMANDGDSPGGANADIHFGFQTLSSSGSTSSRTGTYTTSGGYTLMGLLVGIEPSTTAVLADAGAGADRVAVTATVPLADSAAAATSLTVAAAVTLADHGVAANTLTVAAAVTLGETGSGAERLNITATVPLADAGTAVDGITINTTTTVALSDTGSAVDGLTSSQTIVLSDHGSAANLLTVAAAVGLADTGTAVEGFGHPPLFPHGQTKTAVVATGRTYAAVAVSGRTGSTVQTSGLTAAAAGVSGRTIATSR